jgi:uncharacterized protein (DUF362 family)
MISEARDFVFKPPPAISRARRVLIKPCASYDAPYPATTSPAMLAAIIEGIRQVSDADILVLDGTPDGSPIQPVYRALGYDFPRVLMLDVKDCIWVEVDNPLTKALAIPTFWIPNVILSSDYLISVTPLKMVGGRGYFTIMNLLPLLPAAKYGDPLTGPSELNTLGLDNAIADLYFTLPFDMGIIEAQKAFTGDDPARGRASDFGKVFVGEPYEVDREAAEMLDLAPEYLKLIRDARVELEA